jgi:hypothetical protein
MDKGGVLFMNEDLKSAEISFQGASAVYGARLQDRIKEAQSELRMLGFDPPYEGEMPVEVDLKILKMIVLIAKKIGGVS